jgi:ubiquinone/menaquinone biosynthesis C-methylase UbiE
VEEQFMTKARDARFWNLIANRYSKLKIGDEAAYREKLRLTRVHLTPESQVLEFGCGTGGTARLHAPFVRHILAVDISDKMIAIARQRAADEGIGNVSFEVASIDDIGTDRTYDAVLGMSILHLLDNRKEVIGKVYDCLKPGGVFVSSTTCLGTGPLMLRLALPLARPLGLLPSVHFFEIQDLVAEIAGAGFEIAHQWQPGPKAAVFIAARKPG